MMIISQTVKTDLHLTTLGLVSMDELRLFVSQALMTLLYPPPIMIRNSASSLEILNSSFIV